MLDRLDAARLRVLVAGEAKRGKSTLINALLGRAVLPSGVTPLTAVTTTVRYGDDERAEARFLDGHDEKHPLAALADLVTERGNPGNRRGIADVTVYLAAPVLAGGVELVDTPGTGSVFGWGTETAHEALRSMDAAVFVLTADPPVSASERDLLGRVAGLSVATFAVLNKADHLDEAGLAEAVEFTRRVLGEAGHHGTVYPMSARAALGGRDDGFAAFGADFTAYLSARRETDLRASAVAQGRRIAGSLLDEVRLTRRAAEMRAGDAAQRVEQFTARLSDVTVHSHDAVTVVDGESGRLLFALNDAADEDGPRLGREITGQLKAVFDGELRDATAAEIERRGREQLAALAVAAAESWRQQRTEAIEQGLAAVDARLAEELEAELDVLRDSASELLGLDLEVPEPGRPAGREPTVLLHRRPERRPDRAAGRCRPPLAPRRVRQADSQGAPAPCGPGPGRQPGRPGPRRPAVPAGRGDAGAAAGGRAAVCRRHGPYTVRAAGRGRAPGSVGGRGRGEGKRTGRTGGGASSRHGPARPGCRRRRLACRPPRRSRAARRCSRCTPQRTC